MDACDGVFRIMLYDIEACLLAMEDITEIIDQTTLCCNFAKVRKRVVV